MFVFQISFVEEHPIYIVTSDNISIHIRKLQKQLLCKHITAWQANVTRTLVNQLYDNSDLSEVYLNIGVKT